MANELTLSGVLAYLKNDTAVNQSVVNLIASAAGPGLVSRVNYSAPTADTPLPLGSVTIAGGWLFIVNNDPTNFVTLKAAVGGQKIAKLKPSTGSPAGQGYFALIPLDPSITAPSTQADTSACNISYCLFDL